ncbi:MAG: hypothetical protein V7L25_05300 [Nostoc sp.]
MSDTKVIQLKVGVEVSWITQNRSGSFGSMTDWDLAKTDFDNYLWVSCSA